MDQEQEKMGLLSVFCLGINMVLGAGIFLLPYNAFNSLGSYMWLAFFGVILLCSGIALSYAELGSKYKESGSCYLYVKDNLGNYLAFLVGFTRFIVSIIVWAAMANGFTELFEDFIGYKNYFFHIGLSLFLVIFLSWINLRGIGVTKMLNNFFTFAKLIPILFFCFTGIFFVHSANFNQHIYTTEHFNFSQGFLLLFFAYAGAEDIPLLASDMKNPTRDVPIALISVLLILFIIYLLIFFNTQGILGPQLLKTENPIAKAMETYMGYGGYLFVTISTLIALLGSNVSISFLFSRKAVSLAESGVLPHSIMNLNKNNVPAGSIILTTILTCFLVFVNSFSFLAALAMVTLSIQYGFTMISLLVSRKKGMKGTFYLPFAHVVVSFCLILLGYILFSLTWQQLFFGGILWIIIGSLLYLIPFLKKKGIKKR